MASVRQLLASSPSLTVGQRRKSRRRGVTLRSSRCSPICSSLPRSMMKKWGRHLSRTSRTTRLCSVGLKSAGGPFGARLFYWPPHEFTHQYGNGTPRISLKSSRFMDSRDNHQVGLVYSEKPADLDTGVHMPYRLEEPSLTIGRPGWTRRQVLTMLSSVAPAALLPMTVHGQGG